MMEGTLRGKMICLWSAFLGSLVLCGYGSAALCALTPIVLLAAFFLILLFQKRKEQHLLFAAVGAAAAVLLFMLFETLFYTPMLAKQGEAISATGRVTRVEYGTEANRIYLRPKRLAGNPVFPLGKLLLYTEPTTKAEVGDEISFVADIQGYRSAEGGYSSERAFKARGIYLRAYAPREALYLKQGRHGLGYGLDKLSDASERRLYQALEGDGYVFAKALVLGDQSDMPQAWKDLFQIGGLSHALSVSGMHISFLAMLLSFVLNRCNMGFRTANLITALMSGLYVLFINCPASAVRAGVMAILFYVGKAIYKDGDNLLLLFTATGLICLVNPYAVMDISLQLSFLSLLGILVIAQPLGNKIAAGLGGAALWKRMCRFVLLGLTTTLCAMVTTLPLTSYVFGGVSWIAPLANLLILPIIMVMMVLSIGVLLLGGILPLALLGNLLMSVCTGYVMGVLQLLQKLPFAYQAVPFSYVLLGYFAGGAVASLLFALLAKKRRLYALTAVCAAAFMGILGWSIYDQNEVTKLRFMDVGQGESILLTEGRRALVVDCGSSSTDRAGKIVGDRLFQQGITYLDAILVTHGHSDHANGVPYLLEHFPVGKIILPSGENSSDMAEIVRLANQKGVPLWMVEEQGRYQFSPSTSLRLWRFGSSAHDKNASALIAEVTARGKTLLLCSDISALQERQLLRVRPLRADILKVAHHGSDTSSCTPFLRAVAAEYAVVSCGAEDGRFPSPKAVARLKRFCHTYISTREQGEIYFKMTEQRLERVGGSDVD